MYKAVDLSKYIVKKCIDDKKPISNLQLQKILYFIQKKFLKETEKPIFYDRIEAWPFGPVVPNAYYRFCGYGAMPLSLCFQDFNGISEEEKIIIDEVVEEKREIKPWLLVQETHKEGGAWKKTFKQGEYNVIDLDLIKNEE